MGPVIQGLGSVVFTLPEEFQKGIMCGVFFVMNQKRGEEAGVVEGVTVVTIVTVVTTNFFFFHQKTLFIKKIITFHFFTNYYFTKFVLTNLVVLQKQTLYI